MRKRCWFAFAFRRPCSRQALDLAHRFSPSVRSRLTTGLPPTVGVMRYFYSERAAHSSNTYAFLSARVLTYVRCLTFPAIFIGGRRSGQAAEQAASYIGPCSAAPPFLLRLENGCCFNVVGALLRSSAVAPPAAPQPCSARHIYKQFQLVTEHRRFLLRRCSANMCDIRFHPKMLSLAVAEPAPS